ncbi:MAG: DUF2845 domain-containing protein [Gammaproteobacteria bacterium]|nr:DUF2845 domain-containing protein [Gammaproteobacteria bacterium]
MGRFVPIVLVCLGLTSFIATDAVADLRCNDSLVSRGLTPYEVLERCGSPEFEMQFADYRYPGILVHVDEWTYDLGRNKFRRLLTFENGRLVRIETRSKPKRSLQSAFAEGDYR